MEETLRSYGFVECDDDSDTLEFICPMDCVDSLAEVLGIDGDVETLIIQVHSEDTAMVYTDGDSWDVTVDEVLEAVESVF